MNRINLDIAHDQTIMFILIIVSRSKS